MSRHTMHPNPPRWHIAGAGTLDPPVFFAESFFCFVFSRKISLIYLPVFDDFYRFFAVGIRRICDSYGKHVSLLLRQGVGFTHDDVTMQVPRFSLFKKNKIGFKKNSTQMAGIVLAFFFPRGEEN